MALVPTICHTLRCACVVAALTMMLPPLSRIWSYSLNATFPQTFCERRLGSFSTLDRLLPPSCDLHVSDLLLTSSQTTTHT